MGLVEVLRESNLPPDTNYFLLVDQFEEIFAARQGGAVDETDAFVALLLATAAQRELPVYIVVTMRTDWLGECPVFQGLPEEINKSLFLAPRLTRHEKREAIVGPAKLLGGDIDEELLATICSTRPALVRINFRFCSTVLCECGNWLRRNRVESSRFA